MAGCTALQALRDTANLGSSERVLVNGASGGVGLMAVQIAKALGAEVTAVCSGRNHELVRSVGADHLVDYTTEDFLDTDDRYDVVVDTVMTRSPRAVTSIMADGGRYALVGALEMGDWIGPIGMWLKPTFASIGRSQRLGVTMATEPRSDLEVLAGMAERGEIRTVIDRIHPLEETAAGLAHVEAGHARGKVIIDVAGG
jgi:NADPH:quinone reductase-like Zn-dependent oxidoreductase